MKRITEEFERAWRDVEAGKVRRPGEEPEQLLPRDVFAEIIAPLGPIARRGNPSGVRKELNEAAGRLSDDILFRQKQRGTSLVTVVLCISSPSLTTAQIRCHIQITSRWNDKTATNITFSGRERVFSDLAHYPGFIGGYSSSIAY